MKLNLILLSLLLICVKAKAQFAVIDDKDGYVNLRKEKSVKSAIVKKLDNQTIVRIWDEEPDNIDWLNVYFQTGYANGVEGYIHKSRLKFIFDFESLKNIKHQPNFCSAKNDSIYINISSSKFVPKAHRIKYHKQTNNEGSYYESIDGKPIWGTDGELPKQTIAKLIVITKSGNVIIPASAFNDLYEPRFSTLQVYISPGNTIYIELDNSDGAGAYSVIWMIKNGKYINRYIDNSEA